MGYDRRIESSGQAEPRPLSGRLVRLRRLLATPGELVEQLQRLAETVQLHDTQIRAIADVLRLTMEPPEPPRGKLGFHPPSPA
jgi:hypothetical protein